MSGHETFQPGNGTHARFPSQTQWTALIQPAADHSSPEAQAALNQLCQNYWFPVYAFIRSERIDSHRAKDLTQGFFVHLLAGNLIRQANREKGRFRTFLLACLRHFLHDQWRQENAIKRGGNVTVLSLDDADAEAKYQQLPLVEPAPETAFDRTWAATVIEQAMRRLRQSYAEGGKAELFDAVQGCLSGALSPAAYPEVSARLGMTKETFEVNLSRFRKAFGGAVRSVIAETVDPAEINEEIKYLMAAWAAYLNAKP
jgi:RNA polymerase sigma factor (sigma-70 family)